MVIAGSGNWQPHPTKMMMLADIERWCKHYPEILPSYNEILLHWNNIGHTYKRKLYVEVKAKVAEFIIKTSF